MSLLNLSKISTIQNLSDDDIEKNGKLILADLRGHLTHENELFALATKEDLTFRSVPEEYPDPLTEIDLPPVDNSAPPSETPPLKPRKRKK